MNFRMPLFSRGRSSRSTSKISTMNLQPRSSIKNDLDLDTKVEKDGERPPRKLFSNITHKSSDLPPDVIAGSIKQESVPESKPVIGTEKIISKSSFVKRRSAMPLLFQEKPKTKYFTQKMEEDASKWKYFIGKSTSEYVSGDKPDEEVIHNPKHSNVLGIEKKRYGPSWDPYMTSIEDDFQRLPKNTSNTLETMPDNNKPQQQLELTEIKDKEKLEKPEKPEQQITLEITEDSKKPMKKEELKVNFASVPNNTSQEEEDLSLPTWLRKNKNKAVHVLVDKEQNLEDLLKEKKEIESWDDKYLPTWLRKNKNN